MSEATSEAVRERDLRDITVAEMMSRPVVTVAASLSLSSALARFVVSGLRHLVVVDSSQRCVGVLTDRMIAATWHMNPGRLDVLSVGDVLPGHCEAIIASTPVTEAAHLMLRNRIDALPVVLADGSPVGILTGSDLVGLIASGTSGGSEP